MQNRLQTMKCLEYYKFFSLKFQAENIYNDEEIETPAGELEPRQG